MFKRFVISNFIDFVLRLFVPVILIMVLALEIVLPLSFGGIKPYIWLCIVGFWSIYRPDLLNTGGVLVFAIFHDLMLSVHFGSGILAILLSSVFLRLMSLRFHHFGFSFFLMIFAIGVLLFFFIDWL
ncbi:MAG: hypothetical protein AAF403_08920, partial [Pseudomonadota bacterium]